MDCLKGVLRQKLVHHDSCKYEGYRLTTLGYDFLALRALVNRGAISAVGQQIGVGKESDVFEVLSIPLNLGNVANTLEPDNMHCHSQPALFASCL